MNQPEENITQLNEAVQAAHLGHMLGIFLWAARTPTSHLTT